MLIVPRLALGREARRAAKRHHHLRHLHLAPRTSGGLEVLLRGLLMLRCHRAAVQHRRRYAVPPCRITADLLRRRTAVPPCQRAAAPPSRIPAMPPCRSPALPPHRRAAVPPYLKFLLLALDILPPVFGGCTQVR